MKATSESWEKIAAFILVMMICAPLHAQTILPIDTLRFLPSGYKAWVWADKPSTNSYTPDVRYQYNSSGGTNRIVRLGVGYYRIEFPGLGTSGGMVQVSSYGGNHSCTIEEWKKSESSQFVTVRCFKPDGRAIDGQFTVLFYTESRGENRNEAYVLADQPTVESYTPAAAYQWNATGRSITVRRLGVGQYEVTLPGIVLLTYPYRVPVATVLVSAYGTSAVRCKEEGKTSGPTGVVVKVRCVKSNGAPVDAKFTLSYINDLALGFPSSPHFGGYVWANNPNSASYIPERFSQWNSAVAAAGDEAGYPGANGSNLIMRLSTGVYEVHLPLLASSNRTTALVTAHGTGNEYATIGHWQSDGDFGVKVHVKCFNSQGNPVDTRFNLVYLTDDRIVLNDIRKKWLSLGGPRSALGDPTHEAQRVPRSSPETIICNFEHGTIQQQLLPAPLSFFQQNMALLPATVPAGPERLFHQHPYRGTERNRVLPALIDYLRRERPDVVGLCEVFVDDERERIRRELRDVYPFALDAPDELDLHQDGALLLLSKHQIIQSHTTIYRPCEGNDCWANKGAIHARIRVSGQGDYDIFLSHLQANSAAAWGALQAQLSDLGRFVQAYKDPKRPAFLMGDLNTNAREWAQYSELKRRLNNPDDLWEIANDGSAGFTVDDPENTFPGTTPPGKRVDYALAWHGTQSWIKAGNTQIVRLFSSPGRNLSDHYGIMARQSDLQSFTVEIRRPITKVKITLTEFKCLTVTTGTDVLGGWEPVETRGADNPYFKFYYRTANGATAEGRTRQLAEADNGETRTFGDRNILESLDPGAWMEIIIRGYEYDTWSGDDLVGESVIRLERRELLELLERSTIRVMPYFTGEGGEWAVTVAIAVE